MERESFSPGAIFGASGNSSRNIFGTDLLHIGNMTFAQMGQGLNRNPSGSNVTLTSLMVSTFVDSGRVRSSFHYSCRCWC